MKPNTEEKRLLTTVHRRIPVELPFSNWSPHLAAHLLACFDSKSTFVFCDILPPVVVPLDVAPPVTHRKSDDFSQAFEDVELNKKQKPVRTCERLVEYQLRDQLVDTAKICTGLRQRQHESC